MGVFLGEPHGDSRTSPQDSLGINADDQLSCRAKPPAGAQHTSPAHQRWERGQSWDSRGAPVSLPTACVPQKGHYALQAHTRAEGGWGASPLRTHTRALSQTKKCMPSANLEETGMGKSATSKGSAVLASSALGSRPSEARRTPALPCEKANVPIVTEIQ